MNEPKPLIDECESALERQLLMVGRSSSSTNVRRLKVLTALGVGAAVVGTSKTSFALALSWKKALVAGAVACAGVVGAVAYQASSEPEPSSGTQALADARLAVNLNQATVAPAQVRAARVVSPSAASPADLPVQPSPAQAEAVAQPEMHSPAEPKELAGLAAPDRRAKVNARAGRAPQRRVVARGEEPREVDATQQKPTDLQRNPEAKAAGALSDVETRPADPASTDNLRAEIALLDHARSALNAGSAAEALQRLGQHQARFPKGRLRLEAEVLRIEALAANGQGAEASRRAQRILERSPNSIVAARLRRFVLE